MMSGLSGHTQDWKLGPNIQLRVVLERLTQESSPPIPTTNNSMNSALVLEDNIGDETSDNEANDGNESPENSTTFQQTKKKISLQMPTNKNHAERKIFDCDICGKVFDKPTNLNKHKLIHPGQEKFKCDECNKVLSTWEKWNTHTRGHDRANAKPFECDACGMSFHSMGKLEAHENSRKNCKGRRKSVKCVDCGEVFWTLREFKNHEHD